MRTRALRWNLEESATKKQSLAFWRMARLKKALSTVGVRASKASSMQAVPTKAISARNRPTISMVSAPQAR